MPKLRIRLEKKSEKRVNKFFDDQPREFKRFLKISLSRIGEDALAKAKTKAPIKTGTLRRSLGRRGVDNVFNFSQEGHNLGLEIGTNVFYARAQEFGAKGIRPKLYFTRAMKQMRREGKKIMLNELKSVLNRI